MVAQAIIGGDDQFAVVDGGEVGAYIEIGINHEDFCCCLVIGVSQTRGALWHRNQWLCVSTLGHEFSYKPLSYKDLADASACLVRLNMLLFVPTIKKRVDFIALFLQPLAGVTKRIGQNSPKGAPSGKEYRQIRSIHQVSVSLGRHFFSVIQKCVYDSLCIP